jgi:hypothetical protein
MSKKMMVLALAVVSAAFFALPAMASALEDHLEPAEKFTVSGSGGELRTSGEPTITCTETTGTGEPSSSTTGFGVLTFGQCHATVFGITAACKSEGSAVSNQISNKGTYHIITDKVSGAVATLFTTEKTVVVCAGISKITVTGSVIGTITSPKCGESSKTVTISYAATESTQNHLTYTGVKYDLLAKTGEGENKTSAIVGTATNTQANAAKLVCT